LSQQDGDQQHGNCEIVDPAAIWIRANAMLRQICLLALGAIVALAAPAPSRSADNRTLLKIQEEVWALPLIHPTVAYVVRPVGNGPFPLAVMNHGVSLNPVDRGFFPLVEFRDAAMWFARRGYMVVAPTGSGYGAAALDVPEQGLFSVFYSKIGQCENPNFRDAGMAVAALDKWVIDYMTEQKLALPDSAIFIGQSAGGWAAIALSSQNPPSVKAIIAFAAGRGGRVGGKPNNNCNPDKLVEITAGFGRTARVPMLWIYIENDTYFGPDLSKRMHAAYTDAGGSAEYHLMPPFGNEGHIFIDSPDSIPQWSPLVSQFLDTHR
jgi:dienelactone hydrolase